MANIITNAVNNMFEYMAQKISAHMQDTRGKDYQVLGRYYEGNHRPQLKITQGRQDDNIIQNWVGLVVDRSISRLYQGGVKWKLPEGSDEQQEYLQRVWDLNKQEIFLYQLGLHGAIYGTPFVKISPDGLVDPYTGKTYPRLIALDPETVRVRVSKHDMQEVEEYIIEYSYVDDGATVSYREITKHKDNEQDSENDVDTWVVETWEQRGGGAWMMVESYDWLYPFPPIIHWKNLPSLKSAYGDSEIDDAVNIQDKSNFVASNTSKIIKFHAHPETIGTGFSVKDMTQIDSAVGTFRAISNDKAQVFNLEMQSDLSSSRAFGQDLRQSIFDISREVDLSSLKDNLGALTNFGLRVLYTDSLNKNDTKRQLYGDAFKELNRRLLVLGGWEMQDSNPGSVVWGDAMPINVLEELQADQLALDLQLVDRETVAKRYQNRYGVDYENIKENLQNEKTQANENNDNIGAMILRNFNQGRNANAEPATNNATPAGATPRGG